MIVKHLETIKLEHFIWYVGHLATNFIRHSFMYFYF